MRVIFLGTPDFAVGALESIFNSKHEIAAVVTQPDKPGDRNKVAVPPVKRKAVELGLEVLQYSRVSREGAERLRSINADIMVTCAYGQILSDEILAIAPHGVINVHASLLPLYRGSSPIQCSILNGDKVTGVTIMQTAKEVDSGDIILQRTLEIGKEETAGELFDRLSKLGAQCVVEALDDIEAGIATFTPQDHARATHCKMLRKQDGLIDFSRTSNQLQCFVRGMNPWPCAYAMLKGEILKVHKAEIADIERDGAAGEILSADNNGLIVKTGDGALRLSVIQAAGSKRMADTDYLRGHKTEKGLKFNE